MSPTTAMSVCLNAVSIADASFCRDDIAPQSRKYQGDREAWAVVQRTTMLLYICILPNDRARIKNQCSGRLPCSRGAKTQRLILLMRRDLKPGVVHCKGLADEPMGLLP